MGPVTHGADVGLIAVDVLLKFYGVVSTYTESTGSPWGGIGQQVLCLEENFSVSDHTATMEFTFETTDLTITNWRGATITTTTSGVGVFKIINKEDSDGHTKFTGVRDIERS